jgi:glycosyltransferase involved in cell wall biosynthesis
LELIWIGDLIRRKQLDILLNSLINIGIDYHLNVVGDGPELKKLESFSIKNKLNVDFIGRVSRDKVFEFLKNSNTLIHTSYREGTATTLIEAVSFNNFVIAHDIGGHDLVINKSTGVLIPLISKNVSIKQFREALIESNRKIQSISSFNPADFQFNWLTMTSIIYNNYLNEI